MNDTPETDGVSSPIEGEEHAAPQPPDVAPVDTPEPAPTAEHLGLSLPDDPDEAKHLLLRELEESRQEVGELLTNLQRIAAEFDNYRKRTERDQIENVQRAGQRLIESLLPTLDSLDAALAIEATTEGEERMLEGMRGTEALLLEALAPDGFERINALGTPFDPALHEAVQVVPGDGDEQVVQQVLRKGYVMRGRVIRPSLVIVGHA
ncbi:MAG: nucleotide exchange factor GrpE [Acidimicrobiia bacterium]